MAAAWQSRVLALAMGQHTGRHFNIQEEAAPQRWRHQEQFHDPCRVVTTKSRKPGE